MIKTIKGTRNGELS
jgi:hypothetical protein